METPDAIGKDRFRGRGLRGALLVLLIGQAMLLFHLVQHRSINPAILDRYSVKFSIFLGGLCLWFIASGVLVGVTGRKLPLVGAWVAARYQRVPGAIAALLALGMVLVGGSAFFHVLIAQFFPVGPFIGSTAVICFGLAGVIVSAVTRRQAVALGQRVLLILLGVGFGFGLGEVGLRLMTRSTPYRILPVGMHASFRPAPDRMPGIAGVSTYTTNEVGIRGDPYDPEGRYTVLAIGGSTTECAYLDNTEAWPYLLQQNLNREGYAPPVWVGNVGRSGHALAEHIHALRYFVPQFRMDAVVVMAGVNDLAPAWWDPAYYDVWADPDNFSYHLHRSFYSRPLVDAAISRRFPENMAVWNAVEQGFWSFYHSLDDLRIEDLAGLNYERRRQRYRSAPIIIDDLPGLSIGLEHYERNLLTLIEAARAKGVRLILVTQPVLWSDHLSPEAEDLLWFGITRSSARSRYSPGALARAMDRFNAKLLDTCAATNTECVDPAATMNGDERYFYDDVHFNEAGAQAVARLLADYLKPE